MSSSIARWVRVPLPGLLVALAVLVALVCATAPAARANATRTFPLAVHVATTPAPEFLEARVRRANERFAEASVAFEVARVVPIPDRHARLVTREDRDALGEYHSRDAIDVFVVESLTDVDTPPLPRRGVHWRDRTRPGVRYVVVIAGSSEWVLAHELGHYFGLGHSDVAGNLMSYRRGDGDPFLDATQLSRISASATRLAQTRRFGIASSGR